MSCGYRTWLVHFGLVRFFMAIPTENEGDEETRRTKGRGERSRRRGRVRFCVNILALPCFPPGVRWGSAPQTCAKESNVEAALRPLWTLFTLRRGWVGADSPRLCVFAQSHWPCESFRGESVGGYAPPNLRQRAIGSLDSLHLGRDVGALYAAKPCALYAGAAGNYWPMIIPIASAVMR